MTWVLLALALALVVLLLLERCAARQFRLETRTFEGPDGEVLRVTLHPRVWAALGFDDGE